MKVWSSLLDILKNKFTYQSLLLSETLLFQMTTRVVVLILLTHYQTDSANECDSYQRLKSPVWHKTTVRSTTHFCHSDKSSLSRPWQRGLRNLPRICLGDTIHSLQSAAPIIQTDNNACLTFFSLAVWTQRVLSTPSPFFRSPVVLQLCSGRSNPSQTLLVFRIPRQVN